MELVEREQRRIRGETTNTVSENASIRKELDSVRSSLADTRANLQQVQRDLNAVKEKVEEVRYQTDRRLGQSSQEGDQRVKDLEGRVAKISEDLKALNESRAPQDAQKAPPSQSPPPEGAGVEIAREKVTGESEAVRRDYEAATRLLEQKDYRGSINRFKEFIKKYPKSDYADNAQYWIGECYYALREFDQAILEFDAVRRNYPKGDKVPAALLKQGFAFAELGDKVDARLILQELINRYPQSPEAGRAKQKLKTLES